ncbi:MAG: hypothetical protein FWF29_07130 [Treponema sp.]|nr:hypothetical protein [Treponema sp.]
MTVTQTVEIPANRRITIDVPQTVPIGRTILAYTPASEAVTKHSCPVCARKIDPETGNPRYNAETVAAIEEGMAISRGEIQAKRYNSLAEMLKDLNSDDSDVTFQYTGTHSDLGL